MAQLVVTPGTRPALGARLLSRRRTADTLSAVEQVAHEETTDPRTTLAHVRVLEATLEEQVRRVAELTEALAIEQARPHEDVRRVSATVEGLRVAFGKDAIAQRLLARIDAALDRLVEPGALVRVPLPDPEPARSTTRAATPAAGATASPIEPPAGTAADEPADDAGDDTAEQQTPSTTRVLPLPAEVEPTTAHRRRGLRR